MEEDYSHMGMDAQTRRYLKKIVATISYGLLWMFFGVTVGLYMGFAVPGREVRWFNIAFYVLDGILFLLLLRFFYRVWRKA